MRIVINIGSEVKHPMIVCICHGISDRTIDRAIDEGCRSVRQVGRRCRAGTDCGACRASIKSMIRDAKSQQAGLTSSGLLPAVGVL